MCVLTCPLRTTPHCSLHNAGKWQAKIKVRGVRRSIGAAFEDEVTAARAYDHMALHHGLVERMNFPPEGVKSLPACHTAPRGSSQYRGVNHTPTGKCPLLISCHWALPPADLLPYWKPSERWMYAHYQLRCLAENAMPLSLSRDVRCTDMWDALRPSLPTLHRRVASSDHCRWGAKKCWNFR